MVAHIVMRLGVIMLALAGLSGCYTEHFNYSVSTHGRVGTYDCHILSGIGTVENEGDSIIVHPGARFSARKMYETFNEGECYVRVRSGNAMRVRMRSVDFGDSVFSGIALTLGKDKSYVQVEEGPPRTIAPVLDSGLTRIGFFSEGSVARITVGCDTVFSGKTRIPGTDVLVFESIDGSEFVVRGMSAHTLR